MPKLYSVGKRRPSPRAGSAAICPSGLSRKPILPVVALLENRTLLSVAQNADGWTVITPAPASQVIYVSSSTGNNANDGLSPDRPVATLGVGIAKLRDHTGDQLLLKCGDVWHGDLNVWRKSGKSADEPMVIGSYGVGPRPLLMTGKYDGFDATASSNTEIDHIAIMGIHFYCDARDPNSPTFAGSHNATGMNILTKTDGLLIENCELEDYGENINVEQFFGPIQNVSIRRNVIADAYATDSHSQGLYCNGISNLLIEGNVFDHNGFNDAVSGAEPTWYNHDAYLASNNINVTVKDNIFAEAAGYGLQARAGGLVEDNLFINDPVGMSFGLVNGASVTPGGVSGIVNGNVFVGGANIGTIPLGEGMEVGNTRTGYPTIISNNIFTHSIARAPAAITLTYGIGQTNPQDSVGLNDLTIEDNIINDWNVGIHVDGGFTPGSTGAKALDGVRVRENDFQNIGAKVLAHDDPFYTGYELWSDNNCSPASPSTHVVDGKKTLSVQQWSSDDEAGAHIAAVPYADADASIEAYSAGVGGQALLADFLGQARQQSQQNWRPQYEAAAVLGYYRAAFQNTAAPARDWRAPTPPIAAAAMPPAVLDHDSLMQFTVSFTDDKAVDVGTIASGGVSVLVAKTRWNTAATLVSVQDNGASATATYSFSPAGGLFHKGKAQRFIVMMNDGQVRDNDGFAVTVGAIGAFRVRVLPRPKPPTVKSAKLINHGQVLQVRFSEDVSASLTAGALSLTNTDGQTIDTSLTTLSLDAPHHTATWAFTGEPDGILPAGAWHLRLTASQIADTGGRQLDGNHDGIGGDDYAPLKPILSNGGIRSI